MKYICLLLALCLVCTACTTPISTPSDIPPAENTVPLRGVWLSFLELDSALKSADIPTAKAYIDSVMQTCKDKHLNAVFFHVRAHSDAYYASDIFPIAAAIKPLVQAGFDPLAYAVDSAHAAGLQLHAWINPYRIGETLDNAVCEDVFLQDEVYYYVPTSLTAQRKILDGVRELVNSYTIDGVQYDDYFYPAGIPKEAQIFENIPKGIAVGDTRRAAVNTLITATYQIAHSRAGCVFGVSPAVNIFRNRETLYADVGFWLKTAGCVDYVCPQLYTGFVHETLPFDTALAQWQALPRAAGVKLYAGLAVYKAGTADDYAGIGKTEWQISSDILSRQCMAADTAKWDGVALFRYAYVINPSGEIAKKETAALIDYISQY